MKLLQMSNEIVHITAVMGSQCQKTSENLNELSVRTVGLWEFCNFACAEFCTELAAKHRITAFSKICAVFASFFIYTTYSAYLLKFFYSVTNSHVFNLFGHNNELQFLT